jgi:hypothetical protein
MRTPAGTECRYYYEDFNRGRTIQECRLISASPGSRPWRPSLCETCPVPAILRANGCTNMALEARVSRRWLVIPQVRVRTTCSLSEGEVAEPMVGCGRCQDEGWQSIREALSE